MTFQYVSECLSFASPPKKKEKGDLGLLKSFKNMARNAFYTAGSKSCIAANTQKVISKLYVQRKK